jgi:glycosyltransferase involved in cell wall biosynthesis
VKFLFFPGYRYPANLEEPIICGDLRFSFNLTRTLVKKGHDVKVITRGRTGDINDSVLDGVHIYRYKSEFNRFFSTSFDISINRTKLFSKYIKYADVVVSNSPLSLEQFCRIRKPLIYICSGLQDIKNYSLTLKEIISFLTIKLLRDPLKKMTWERSYYINTIAEKEDIILLQKGVPEEKIRTISSGVEMDRYFPHPAVSLSYIKDKLGIKSNEKIILSVSRFTPAKGILETLDGFAELSKTKKNVKLIIVGIKHSHDLNYFDYIKKKIPELHLQEKVIIKENVSERDLPKYYSLADVFTIFSKGYDPLPTTIIESMACGTPVISTHFKTREQFIVHNDNGVFVKENDISDWVMAVSKLMDDSQYRTRIIQNGLKTVQSQFDMYNIADEYLDLLGSNG